MQQVLAIARAPPSSSLAVFNFVHHNCISLVLQSLDSCYSFSASSGVAESRFHSSQACGIASLDFASYICYLLTGLRRPQHGAAATSSRILA